MLVIFGVYMVVIFGLQCGDVRCIQGGEASGIQMVDTK